MRGLAWVVVVACGAPVAPPPATSSAPAAGASVVHAPHGSVIDQIAVTDGGDAALTRDEDGALRLWPSFDGKHEPVVIAASPALQISIARSGDGLLLALLDRAGGIVLQHRTRAGAFVDQVALPPEPGFDDVQLVGTTVLALGRDQRIMRYDERGRATGSLGAPPTEEILALAVRGSHAVAAIARRGQQHVDVVRAIALTGSLAWGPPLRLPEQVSSVSLSPDGKRLAGVGATTGHALLVELVPKLVVRSRGKILARAKDPFDGRRPNEAPPRTGFVDNDRVAVMPAGMIASFDQPDALVRIASNTIGVVGDRVVVASDHDSLMIMLRGPVRFLGYRYRTADNQIAPAGKDLAFVSSDHAMQLDARLRRVRTAPLPDLFQSQLVPIDERRVIYAVAHDGGYRFVLRDLVTGAMIQLGLGTFLNNAVPYYEPTSRVLAIKDESVTYRYALDPTKLAVTRLPSLSTPTWGTFALLDPKQAGGAIAVTVEPSRTQDTSTIATYHEGGEPIRSRSRVEIDGTAIGTDRTGTTYVLDGRRLTRYQHGKSIGDVALTLAGAAHLELTPSGGILALGDRKLIMFGRDGVERWRTDVQHADQLALTHDGQTIVIDTAGGLIAIDAGTGARVASACAWDFGLYDEPLPAPSGAPSVCAE